jgi:hypothetical protein
MRPELSFDQWAEHIGSVVRQAFPQCRFKRKLDDVYRWAYGAKECQLYAISDEQATFVTLIRDTIQPNIANAHDRVPINERTSEEIAYRIIRWFER